eukprot:tig00000411_g577.t1
MCEPVAKLSSGASIPRIGLGTWAGPDAKELTKSAVRAALDAGCRHIDTAAVYQTEAYVGEVLAEALEPKGKLRREELFVTTKLWNTDHERALVRPACERSLKELGLKYVDLYLMHWPIAFAAGEGLFPKDGNDRMRKASVPVRETWEAMEALVDAGLVRTIGVSNFKIRDLEELLSYARIKPAVNQVELHPYLAQPKLLDFCTKRGIHLTAYSPLGAQPDNPNAVKLLDDPVIGDIAKRIGRSPAQVVLRWNLQRSPHVSVVPKSYRPARIAENLDVFGFALSEADMAAVSALNKDQRTCRHEWTNYYDDKEYDA